MDASAPRVNLSRDLPRTTDLVIIGGGIIGAATAFFAAQAGLRVVVLERRPALATLTTPASTGAFRAQFDNPEEMALARETISFFERFAEVTGLAGYDLAIRKQGYLFCTTDLARVPGQQAIVERQKAWGLNDIEWLDGDEARRRFPYLAPGIAGARWRAGDGWLDVRRLSNGYALAAQRIGGAVFVTGTEVTGLVIEGGSLSTVETTRGVISAPVAVIAAGPFSGVVGAMAGVQIPLSLVRRQKLIMPEAPEVPSWAPMTIDEDTGSHWRPALNGAFCLRTTPGVPPGPPLDDVPISADFAFGLLDPDSPFALSRVAPFWRSVWSRGTANWYLQAGQYDYSPDHRPYLGATGVTGLLVNCGSSGHGIMTSAAGSRIVIDSLMGKLAHEDNPFRLDRRIVHNDFDVL